MDPSLPSVDHGQHQRSADYTATTGQIETDISGVLARGGAPWARKFGFLCFHEILVVENRPYVLRPRFLVLETLSLVCLLGNHVTLLLSHQSLSACKDGGYREYGLLMPNMSRV